MNPLDITVIVVFMISTGLGYWRGFVYELLSMFGWPIAYLLSQRFAPDVAAQLPINLGMLLIPVTYALIFVVALIVWGLVILGFFKLVKAIGLGKLDKALGIGFGVIRAMIVLLALVLFCGLTTLPDQPVWSEAFFSQPAEDFALSNKHYLPPDLAQRIHYKNRR